MTHYYDEKQTSSLNEQQIVVHINDDRVEFLTASGIFSKDHVDKATRTLIEAFVPQEGERTVLDLGCGWGVVAVMLKKTYPDLDITATDVNERAVAYTKKNGSKHGVDLKILQSDVFSSLREEKFDVILTNPPYAAGREICFKFITESYHNLNPGGRLLLVARHQKGGKVLREKMEFVFGAVETLKKSGGFHVYCSKKE